MSDSYTNAQNALDGHLNDFAVSQGLPVQWENGAFDPPDGQAWLRVKFMSADSLVKTLGDDPDRELLGSYHVSVSVPDGSGTYQPNQIADRLVAHFKVGTRFSLNGVNTAITNGQRKNGMPGGAGHYMVPVVFRWRIWAA